LSEHIVSALKKNGVEFVAGVPDSLLNPVIQSFDSSEFTHVRAPNEGSAIALAAGWSLTRSSIPLVYMQNSGLGNAVSPLMSLAHEKVYGLQMILLIGWRGRPGNKDEPQHLPQGEATIDMLTSMGIPYRVLEDASDMSQVDAAFQFAASTTGPSAVLIGPKTLSSKAASGIGSPDRPFKTAPSRADYLEVLLAQIEERDLYVSTTGYTSREAFVQFENHKALDQLMMNVGAMGHAISIALGLAISQPGIQVFCLDGDGSMAMHLGGLSGVADQAPSNLVHVVFNNKTHESVGAEPTVLAETQLSPLASALGYQSSRLIDSAESLKKNLVNIRSSPGPHFIELHTALGVPSDLPRPSRSPKELLGDLRSRILGLTASE
jgi:phosphonopyruvate decarboxylase